MLAPDALVSANLDPETIVKTGLISESFGLSSSALAFIQYDLVDRKLALSLVGGAVPFVVVGALLSFITPAPVFRFLLGVALIAAAFLLFRVDLDHESPGTADDTAGDAVSADGSRLPDDQDKPGAAGVDTDDDGKVTRVDRDGNDYHYTRGGWAERFGNYLIGSVAERVVRTSPVPVLTLRADGD
jgi:hypothetical protein